MPATATATVPCQRCGGSKYLRGFEHVENGRCFLCGGAGVVAAQRESVPAPTRARLLDLIRSELDLLGRGDDWGDAYAIDRIREYAAETCDPAVIARADAALVRAGVR